MPTVSEFRAYSGLHTFNIGGNHKGDIDEFKQWILATIKYAKVGKPFEKIVLGDDSEPTCPHGKSLWEDWCPGCKGSPGSSR
jgi:hypothetical protein